MDDHVYDLAVYNGELIAGGFFSEGGGNTCVRHIGRFNGTRWKRLACGTDGPVSALLPIGSDLYAGGSFQLAGPAMVKNVARWDGTTWYPVGTEINGHVMSLAQYGADIVAGGSFDVSDGSPGNGVARWDGSSWQALGQGVSGWVLALQEFGGHLYAGGWFTEAEGVPVTNLVRWDGSQWSDFGTTLFDAGGGWGFGWGLPVEVLTTAYDGNLLVGGSFTHINGLYVNGLAEWDGSSWTPLGVGLSDGADILDVAVYNDGLVAFGYFAGPAGSDMIARWQGEWSGFGHGCELYNQFGGPGAAAVLDGDLYVGGNIAYAGGKPSAYIARWTDEGATDAPIAVAAPLDLSVRPNPFVDETTITYSVGTRTHARLAVYDASGRLVRTLVDDFIAPGAHSSRWTGTDVSGMPAASGVYFLRLVAPEGVLSQRVVRTR
jgi:hypothetical protein